MSAASKHANLKYFVLTSLVVIIRVIIVALPFHAFLTVFLSSHIGHYTLLRLWKEVLLAFASIGTLYLVLFDSKTRTHTLSRRLVQLVLAYCVLTILLALWAVHRHQVTHKAAAYGVLINVRFFAFFLICWATAIRTSRVGVKLERLVIGPALVVIGFGLLQVFVLPNDFLRHFGYGPKTIAPYQTINSNSHYVRIESTLRGVNELGNYLILTTATILAYTKRLQLKQWLLLIGSFIVLLCTYSRAAWIGVLVAISCIVLPRLIARFSLKRVGFSVVGIACVLALVAIPLRSNSRFQNVTLHTQTNSAIKSTSDGGHLSGIKNGLHDIIHQPLGRGPGTAGPASYYNAPHPIRIAEDYFIQIGQEAGVLGLGLFLLITGGVGYLLWCRRRHPLALALLASLIGICFVNLFSHAWTDDTIAYIWWGLAGIAMAVPATKEVYVSSKS